MKMNMDRETLVKQRFWLLLGLFVVLFLVCPILLWTGVAQAIGGQKKKIDDAQKNLKGLQKPTNSSWITALDKRKQKAAQKRQEIWSNAWNSQKDLMVWPANVRDRVRKLRFGDDIDPSTRDDYMKPEGYPTVIMDIVKIVDPVQKDGKTGVVQFAGGWKNILNYIHTWDQGRPTTEETWLAQEDLAVQRGLLEIIAAANNSVAAFKNQGRDEIEAVQKRRAAAEAKLKKSRPARRAPARGRSAEAAPTEDPAAVQKQIDADTALLRSLQQRDRPDTDKGEIDRQTFTNPTWQLRLLLHRNPKKPGNVNLDARLTNISGRQQLLPVKFRVSLRGVEAQVLQAEGASLPPLAAMNLGPMTIKAEPQGIDQVQQLFDWRTAPIKRIERLDFASTESSRTSWIGLKQYPIFEPKKEEEDADKQGTSDPNLQKLPGDDAKKKEREKDTTPSYELTRRRYIDTTAAVRRMPVALVLTIDQAYLQDVLTAVANSRLRIQVTQVEWQHFPRGQSIMPAANPDEEEDTPEDDTTVAPAGKRSRRRTGGLTIGQMFQGALQADKTKDNLAPNLIQVAIYGIASIYESYPPRTEAPAAKSG